MLTILTIVQYILFLGNIFPYKEILHDKSLRVQGILALPI